MAKVRSNISMSLDGYVAGPNQSLDNPLGEGGERLHEWVTGLASWLEAHGKEGGETGVDDQVSRDTQANVGAVVMGRNMFGGGQGPWGDDPWEGWWGDEPPFHVPVFVVTHHARDPLVKGETTFNFVTDGVESAVEQARAAAGDRDVMVAGGASAIQQALHAGLVDEIQVHVSPLFLGGGARLFDDMDPQANFEIAGVVDSPAVTHLTYRVAR